LAISATGNLSANGMEVVMLSNIELGTVKASGISASVLSGTAVNGFNATLANITVGDGATAGTLDASNGTATFCEKDAVHDPNADIVVKKYNSTSQQYDSYSLGVHTLSGTYDDNGTEVQFSWKILANTGV